MSAASSPTARLVLRLHRLDDGEAPPRHVVLDLRARPGAPPPPTPSPLARWGAAAAAAHEACLVVDAAGRVVSMSAAAATLLGLADVGVIGRSLLAAISLVDFDTGETSPDYAARIAPLAVLSGQGLVRSLLRVRRRDGIVITLDTSSAPLHDVEGVVVGSLTFLSPLGG